MEKEELVKYWTDASEIDYKAMENLFSSADYVWSLFLGHLVIEKLLKAIAVKNDIRPIPKIHDLNKLAASAGIGSDDSMKDLFDIITSFNIEARYPDYKREFYNKCDKKFASDYLLKIKEIRSWLLNLLKK
ncbi:MAG: HEPN domain-containing protein [Ignavibacteriaceae bacterium]